MLKGMISLPHDANLSEEKAILEEKGIKIGMVNEHSITFTDCEVSEELFHFLRENSDYYQWKLQPSNQEEQV